MILPPRWNKGIWRKTKKNNTWHTKEMKLLFSQNLSQNLSSRKCRRLWRISWMEDVFKIQSKEKRLTSVLFFHSFSILEFFLHTCLETRKCFNSSYDVWNNISSWLVTVFFNDFATCFKDMQDTRASHSYLCYFLVTLPSREGWPHRLYSLLDRSWNRASRTRTEIKANISTFFSPLVHLIFLLAFRFSSVVVLHLLITSI